MNRMTARFRELFGHDPEVAGQAPGRVNLIGDHTDYNDGFVLPAAIPQQTRVLIARRGSGDHHEAVSDTLGGERLQFHGDNVEDGYARYVAGCIAVIEQRGATVPPLEILIASDVPVGAGLSSSAALEVAVLRGLDRLLGLGLGAVELAQLARKAEVEHVGVQCGIMDQMASSLASPELMLFLDTRSLTYDLRPLPAGAEILVIDSGTRRSLLTSGYNARIADCRAAAAALGVGSLRDVSDADAVRRLPDTLQRRARYVVAENDRVVRAATAAAAEFGQLMNGSHAGLRDDFEVVDPAVDAIVGVLQSLPGVFGARMTGAGFGGACVALVEDGRASTIGREAVSGGRVPGAAVLVPTPKAP